MLREEIGFIHGVPENLDKIWEKEINGRTFIFKKAREKKDIFLYGCEHRGAATSFFSDRDLMPEDIEQLPQFAAFIAAHNLTPH